MATATIVYRPNQLVEVAAVEVLKLIYGDAALKAIPATNKIHCSLDGLDIFILGTYYNIKNDICNNIKEMQHSNVILYDYSPNDNVGYTKEVVTKMDDLLPNCRFTVYKKQGLGVLEALVSHLQNKLFGPPKALMNMHKRLFHMLDTYSLKQQQPETDALVAGIYSSEENQQGPAVVLKRILYGELTLDDVIKKGAIIHENNMRMAKRRAIENSKRITLPDGTLARYTISTIDLVRLTADALLDVDPEAKLAIVERPLLRNALQDHVAFTLVSRDDSIDVSQYAKEMGGGGSRGLAEVIFDCKKRYMPSLFFDDED